MFISKSKAPALAALIMVSVLFPACGGQAYRESDPNATNPVTGAAGNVVSPPNTGGGGTPGDTGATQPSVSFGFQITGSGGTAPTFTTPDVNTDRILKVRITPQSAGSVTFPGSNFTANYGCVSYTVSALGKTVQTVVLAVDGGNSLCQGAPTYQDIDFSDRLGAGHGPVQITVSAARYDFYCQMWYGCQSQLYTNSTCYYSFYPATYSSYCPLRTAYKTHTIGGNLDIQINGTTL